MAYPSDVIVLDFDALIHARLGRGRKSLLIEQAKSFRLPSGTFTAAVVTPELTVEAALADVLRRLRMETGKWDKVSLLLPDSWFRINILEMPSIPDKANEAEQVVRWSLKRTMPMDPSAFRVAWNVLAKAPQVKVLAVSAVETTLAAIERVFASAGFEVVLIEPLGLNIWNAVAVHEHATTRDRVFMYVREGDFTTALFRGSQPLFIRSRNLNGERTIEQEIRLSANYIRDTFHTDSIENCYLAGNGSIQPLAEVVNSEFSSPVHIVSLRDVTERTPEGAAGYDAELTACAGVFTS
jgi:type IV pilus assembly protein PilM